MLIPSSAQKLKKLPTKMLASVRGAPNAIKMRATTTQKDVHVSYIASRTRSQMISRAAIIPNIMALIAAAQTAKSR